MAIYEHKYGELSYYRVFRAWGGKEYQEYVRIKRSHKAAHKKAQEIDARLAKAQKAFCKEQTQSPDYHLAEHGRIRGLRRITVTRKGRSPADVFELRINVPWETQIRRTTISISVHGAEKAFQQSVDKIAEWYGLKPKSEAIIAMRGCFKNYLEEAKVEQVDATGTSAVADIVLRKAKDELSSLTGGLMKGLKRFTA